MLFQKTLSSPTSAVTAPGYAVQRDGSALERVTMRQVSQRLLPLLFALYICNYLDRMNVAIAALQMNRDLRFSATAYGLGTAVPLLLIYAVFQARTQHILEAINESVVAEINFVLSNRAAKQEGAQASG